MRTMGRYVSCLFTISDYITCGLHLKDTAVPGSHLPEVDGCPAVPLPVPCCASSASCEDAAREEPKGSPKTWAEELEGAAASAVDDKDGFAAGDANARMLASGITATAELARSVSRSSSCRRPCQYSWKSVIRSRDTSSSSPVSPPPGRQHL